MTGPEQRDIDWGSADVEGATLTVELVGAGSKVWKQRFASVLTLLETPHNRWGEVQLTKKGIQVAEVQQGAESELRHFLESIVVEVNTALPEPAKQAHDTEDQQRADEEGRSDRQMTAAFRAFADDD